MKSTNRDTYLGGDDCDQRIVDWLAAEFKRDQGIDLKQNTMARLKLHVAAEKARIELSSVEETRIIQPFIIRDASGYKRLDITLTRAKLEQLVNDMKSTNGDIHLGGDDFDRDRRIVDWLAAEFKRDHGIDLKQDIMARCRLHEAAEEARTELSSVEETEINLPFITKDASGYKHFLITLTRAKLEQLVDGPIQRTVPPVTQTVRDIPLLDVTPSTLGIETLGGVFTPLIPKNTTLPTSKTVVFPPVADGQSSVEVHVLQGERTMASENKTIGRFILDELPLAPLGVPQVEVTFNIDANGILNVSAKVLGTGKRPRITLTANSGPAEESGSLVARNKGSITLGGSQPSTGPTAAPEGKGAAGHRLIPCDIVFVIDTTGSMNDKIEGLLDTCQRFVDEVARRQIDWQIALVGFGDLTVREDKIVATGFSKKVDVVKNSLRSIPRFSGGGNTGESSLEAVDRAIALHGFRQGAIKVFMLLTDEPALQVQLTPQAITRKLEENGILTFVVSDPQAYFKTMARKTGGEWFQIGSGTDFLSVIDRLIKRLTQTVVTVQTEAGGDVKRYLQLRRPAE